VAQLHTPIVERGCGTYGTNLVVSQLPTPSSCFWIPDGSLPSPLQPGPAVEVRGLLTQQPDTSRRWFIEEVPPLFGAIHTATFW
jgi:hypothetical protein